MSGSKPRTRLKPRHACVSPPAGAGGGLQIYGGKLPDISCIPKCKPIASQPVLKERKLPNLTTNNTFLENKGKLFGSQSFLNTWRNAVIKTKRIKQEYVSAYGLKCSSENTAMPHLSHGLEKYPAVPNSSPVSQKSQNAGNQFPDSKDSCLPPLHMIPSTSSQSFFEDYYRNRGDPATGDTKKKGVGGPWKAPPLKNSETHHGAGELGPVRLKKYNQYSSLISFPDESKTRTGYHFIDPVNGAPPQFLQRLSELAALECETIHQERCRKTRKTKKEDDIDNEP